VKAKQNSPEVAKKLVARMKNLPDEVESYVGVGGECHVDSRVSLSIRVYINGQYRGTMGPWGDIYPFVGDPAGGVADLYAARTGGRWTWSRRVSADYNNSHWILTP